MLLIQENQGEKIDTLLETDLGCSICMIENDTFFKHV